MSREFQSTASESDGDDTIHTAAEVLRLECRKLYCPDCSSEYIYRRLNHTTAYQQEAVHSNTSDDTKRDPTVDQSISRDSPEVQLCHVCRQKSKRNPDIRVHVAINRSKSAPSSPRIPAQPNILDDVQTVRKHATKMRYHDYGSGNDVNLSTWIPAHIKGLDAAHEQQNTTRQPADSVPLKAVYQTKFSPIIPSDAVTGSWEVHRMAALPDDKVLVLDLENQKLKLFSADYKILDSVGVCEFPAGLAVVSAREVAVTESKYNCIQLYTLKENRFHTHKTIPCGTCTQSGHLYDIAYGNEHFVCLKYVCQVKRRGQVIQVIDMEGHGQTVVQEDADCDMTFQVFAGNGNCFYISDSRYNKVRCLTYEGRLLWEVATPTWPRGMTLAKERLFVVSFSEGVVSEISTDGEMYNEHVIHGIGYPKCIAYQRHRNRLLVSRYDASKNVKVYSIPSANTC